MGSSLSTFLRKYIKVSVLSLLKTKGGLILITFLLIIHQNLHDFY